MHIFFPPALPGKPKSCSSTRPRSTKEVMYPQRDHFRKQNQKGLLRYLPDPLIQDLRKRKSLIIPDKEENLTLLLRETPGRHPGVRSPGFCPLAWQHDHHYPAPVPVHCRDVSSLRRNPRVLCRNSCPACSLCGALIAKGMDKVVTLDQCSISSQKRM